MAQSPCSSWPWVEQGTIAWDAGLLFERTGRQTLRPSVVPPTVFFKQHELDLQPIAAERQAV
eukprot:scaffold323897_cov91-Tisochrysis_lutea.AAC.1